MFKKVVLLLSILLFLFSCKQNISDKETSKTFINFKKYTFNTPNNTKEQFALKKGKTYVLDFWYLECAPCVKQHNEIKKYYKQLLENNIEVIGFSIDQSQENWRNYLKEHQYNWKNYNQFYAEKDLKEDLNIKIFPKYFIVDGDGNIQNSFHSFKKVINHFKLDTKS